MNRFWNGLRTLEEALAGLDDPHGERFSRIEKRLRDLEGRLDQIEGFADGSPEQQNSAPGSEGVVAAG
ncbi:hypothetical protein [Chenggangzhangella methanolivorans]|uniref:Uncharacterized protein n=1 Tax=Chenggangzhangella methanolivorans TaxID=1437009 RepID=A0A9E6RHW1_9HYPH|nr:hypothetical protein [Chenggangzhangella methanolivorans]QZO01731.1 hypothetical protein K6K41_10360 [Chenggangzhangella methanolivorans]